MKVVGLITEYNPFHNGHKYHIEQARQITGADYVIAVMSGNFVQRGAPAMMDKYSRARMALSNGADLVLELPVCYATGSAEYFARGAISILDKLGIVHTLCFGSECGDITLLAEAARLLSDSPGNLTGQIQAYMKDGLTYPTARQRAMEHILPAAHTIPGYILDSPNNILGIEYMKALLHFSSSITPVTIQRISAHYHDRELSEANAEDRTSSGNPVISSATAIRDAIQRQSGQASSAAAEVFFSVPRDVADFLRENYRKTYPITEEDFASIIKYRLRMENSNSLASYLDITPDLAKRIKNSRNLNQSIRSLSQEIKTKNLTLTRINRALLHVLLNIKTAAVRDYMAQGCTPYARVLGVRRNASHLLRSIEQNGRIPVITKVSAAERVLDETGMRMLSEDIFASDLYSQAVYEKYGTEIPNEYKHGICLL
ncbi:putative nucleotidyltransferase [Anaerotaenia torta]|uniref:nucleotidyltransferase n=1 Tax=Anaerotaenia torta TaxID=433293 RepID=UPI003D23E869